MKQLMAANWKMYKTRAEARETITELVGLVSGKLGADREMLVIPPFPSIDVVAGAVAGQDRMFAGAQNMYPAAEGAFTGETSPGMLAEAGATFCLAGHSERRHVMGESDAFVGKKVAYGLECGLSMILCIGEKLDERKAGRVKEVCDRQLEAGLADVPRDVDPARVVIAYEPVWAIGTGEVAGPEQIVEAHALVREKIVSLFGESGRKMRIQYGGSVKPGNASDIMALDNVDGVLVGGASLKADSFSQIVLA